MTGQKGIKTMNVENEGRRPLVTVHGALSDHRIYGPMVGKLGRRRRVITYDQAYFGKAAWPDEGQGFSRQRHEDDLIALIEGMETGPVDLFAWSYGGDVAMHAILRRPDLFHAVVLFDPSVGAVLRHIPEADAAKSQFLDALQPSLQLISDGDELAAARAFFAGVTGLRLTEIEGFGTDVATILADNARTLVPFLNALTGGGGPDIDAGALARLSSPALIVTGERSLLRYNLIADWLCAHCHGAEREVLKGTTHFGPWEKAHELADLAERFLTQAAQRPKTGEIAA